MHLEPHDYRIYYVNIDLRHQYGISVAESQTFLLAKRPQRRRARRNRCFRRLLIRKRSSSRNVSSGEERGERLFSLTENFDCCTDLIGNPNPSCLQTTKAFAVLTLQSYPPPHTVPQVPLYRTSSRPACATDDPAKRIGYAK